MDRNTEVEEVMLSLHWFFKLTDDCPVHGYQRDTDRPIQLCFSFRPGTA
jgi:hypothetical protein